jgi:hypothetical protein
LDGILFLRNEPISAILPLIPDQLTRPSAPITDGAPDVFGPFAIPHATCGDYSDPVGLSRNWHRFNGPHTDQMGWPAGFSGAISTIVSSGGDDIAAFGADPATSPAPQMLMVAKPKKSR